MKHLFKTVPAIVFLTLLIFASCSDDDTELTPNTTTAKPKPLTTMEKLADKDYLLAGLDYTLDLDSAYIDAYKDLDSCFLDDIFRFNSNGSHTVDQGQEKCDEADPQVENLLWSLSGDNTKLIIDNQDGTLDTNNILKNDGDTLRLAAQQREDVDGDGEDDIIFFTVTYKKK